MSIPVRRAIGKAMASERCYVDPISRECRGISRDVTTLTKIKKSRNLL